MVCTKLYYGVMGCHGSHNSEKVIKHNEERRYHREPRFSNCNGRITRLIQDDPIDYCIDEDELISRKLNTPNFDQETVFYSKKCRKWQIHGKWICGLSAGGSRNNVELFATNPQFELIIENHNGYNSREESIYISFKQNNFQTRPFHIALFIYKNEHQGKCLNAEYLLCESPVFSTGPFMKKEMLQAKINLEPDAYVIIPAMYHPHHDNDFTITIITAKEIPTNLQQLKVETESIIYFKI